MHTELLLFFFFFIMQLTDKFCEQELESRFQLSKILKLLIAKVVDTEGFNVRAGYKSSGIQALLVNVNYCT